MNKALRFMSKHKTLLLLILLALLLRLPWLYTTMEKDEGQFGYVAWRWMSGENLYTSLVDNKPPLLYVMYSVPILFFGNSIIPIRILNNLLFLVSVVFFFKLTKRFLTKKTAFFSTLFYTVFMNIPVFEGYLAMSESLLTPFLIMSIYFFEKYVSTKKTCTIFISSIFASISLFIKGQAIFLFFLLISGLFIYKEKNKTRKTIFIILIPIIVILALLFFSNQLFLGLLQMMWVWFIKSSMGFTSGYRPFQYNFIIFMEGSLLLLFSIAGLIKLLQTKMRKRDYFLICWLFLASLFTLTPPAYGHYYIFLIPPLSVFAGIGLTYSITTHQSKKLFILLTLILLLITGALVTAHFPDSILNTNYLTWGWSSLESYDQQIMLAEFIKNTTQINDKIFVLGWEPSIYWLSNRVTLFPLWTWTAAESCSFEKENLMYPVLTSKEIIFLNSVAGCDSTSNLFALIQPRKIHKVGNAEIWQDITCKEFDKNNTDVNYYYLCRALVEDKPNFCGSISYIDIRQDCYYLSALKNDNLSIFSDYKKANLQAGKDLCYTDISRRLSDISFCENVSESSKDYCKGVALRDASYCDKVSFEFDKDICHQRVNWAKNKSSFDFDSCINLLKLRYDKTVLQNFHCRLFHVELTKNINICDYLNEEQYIFFCKASAMDEEKFCYAIKDLILFNFCMEKTTLNPDYCEKISA